MLTCTFLAKQEFTRVAVAAIVTDNLAGYLFLLSKRFVFAWQVCVLTGTFLAKQ